MSGTMGWVSDPTFITIQEFVSKYSISRSGFYRLIKRGDGPEIVKIGNRTLISVESLNRWTKRLPRSLNPPKYCREPKAHASAA